MNYNQCPDCEKLFTGWAKSETCQNCGGKLKKLTQEKFEEEKEYQERKHYREAIKSES